YSQAYVGPTDPTDTSTAVTSSWDGAWATALKNAGKSADVRAYELDNEPSLWNDTHRDVHPAALTYDELVSKDQAAAAAIKNADPTAQVLGPSDWGYLALFDVPPYLGLDPANSSPDRVSKGDLAAYFLKQMKAYADAHGGTRILDYFDSHYYPDWAKYDANDLTNAGTAQDQAMRLEATRTFWDTSYVSPSTNPNFPCCTTANENVHFIPRMRDYVNNNYPGTKLAIGEYNMGADATLNGGLAQADLLGIFGRENLDLATIWGADAQGFSSWPVAFAFRMYRNYDGAGSRFGETSVQSSSSDQSQLSVYGATRASDGAMTLMMVNKTGNDLTSQLNLSHFAPPSSTARVFRYSNADLTKVVQQPDIAVSSSGFTTTYPANSVTLVELGTNTSTPTTAPPTPTTAPPTPTTAPPTPTTAPPTPTTQPPTPTTQPPTPTTAPPTPTTRPPTPTTQPPTPTTALPPPTTQPSTPTTQPPTPTTAPPVEPPVVSTHLTTGPGPGGGPDVRTFTAAGSPAGGFAAFLPDWHGGISVARGQLDPSTADKEIVVGALAGGTPSLRVWNGAGTQVLWDTFAYAQGFTGGVNVAVGDVNGDGIADIITGAGPGGGPHVEVFDGRTHALLRSFFAFQPDFVGGVNVAAADVNGDGKADIIVGSETGDSVVSVFSGADNSLLQNFRAYDTGFGGGVFVAAGDVNGDGFADIITG
ncbi:MAG: FG-GAP repeat protein, partial [Actinobacteria bacterium]|nr:FG-GAP repeat protein [Actinomycetota bacterium]